MLQCSSYSFTVPKPMNVVPYFQKPLLEWFDIHGRQDLPWQHPRHPYRVWISEIMLQQTQVNTVIPYFERFMQRFPEIQSLAEASQDEVLSYWAGLGYYARGRNLHRCAQIIMEKYHGVFPSTLDALIALPGIGRSTAAAILSQAFNQKTPILDANVIRVLSRFFMIEGKSNPTVLWDHAEQCMSATRCCDYTQAIMDLGATCCTHKKPACERCPLQQHCAAYQHQRVSDFPHKPVKRPKPTEYAQFLLLCIEGDISQIYLEKRPDKGIWGGLWCLPQLSQDACVDTFLRDTFDIYAQDLTTLPTIQHSFTHFHLQMQPIKIVLHSIPRHVSSWFTAEQLSQIGLPKPIQQLLHRTSLCP
ncbi:MAG: A/G-specific adenine glycosylase [Legionellaceae bacterium]|nr:A/G-specific adenine glycosylase [Legionellaceae bacterium]